MLQRNFIGGEWIDGAGSDLESRCPVDNEVVWRGREANKEQVDDAFSVARDAFGPWWDLSDAERIAICERFAELVDGDRDGLALVISSETGKPLWESKTEAGAVVGKIAVSIEAYRERRSTSEFEMGDVRAVTRYKPHGVCVVLGPFNFPAHLPNGHIVPALIAGNTVVLKPSELTPWTGQWMLEKWEQAGLPNGVINLVQGGRDVGVSLVEHPQVDALFFTGSDTAGTAIHRAFADSPQKILALEMGGNNPLIVDEVGDLKAAAYLTILSAYFTAGQRCTCARRLILIENENSDAFVRELLDQIGKMNVGFFRDSPEPFMGTVISAEQGRTVLDVQRNLVGLGASPLVESQSLRDCDALVTPGLLDCTGITLEDKELFGPQLKVIRVSNLDEAIQEANDTQYGLSAALLSESRSSFEQFIHQIRAGIVNWNRQTTGASGRMPFGGCGMSGNHRPAAFHAADYCSFPTASSDQLRMPDTRMPGLQD